MDGFDALVGQFLASLGARSPRTYTTYASGLARFRAYLAQTGRLEHWHPDALGPSVLEDFYAWLVRQYGRDRRATLATYSSGLRAFVRFLARRGQLGPGVTYEQMRENAREVMGRANYRSPRIDRRLPVLVTHVLALPIPSEHERGGARRLEALRDRALILTLFCTGMRREEVSRLNRADVDDGWADRALITGKGEKERIVFFDEPTLE
ncbi:MAG: site-specific integrase, partial [Chloroflexota bacterium]|nr:site-specific integrase [Chloroflexota bacterium]